MGGLNNPDEMKTQADPKQPVRQAPQMFLIVDATQELDPAVGLRFEALSQDLLFDAIQKHGAAGNHIQVFEIGRKLIDWTKAFRQPEGPAINKDNEENCKHGIHLFPTVEEKNEAGEAVKRIPKGAKCMHCSIPIEGRSMREEYPGEDVTDQAPAGESEAETEAKIHNIREEQNKK